jgi:hypothetical protein
MHLSHPKPKKLPTNRGLVKAIILIVIALLIISYFGFNLRSLASAPTTQSNFGYVKEVLVNVWDSFLKRPVLIVWNIFITYIWNPAINNLQHPQAISTNTAASSTQP